MAYNPVHFPAVVKAVKAVALAAGYTQEEFEAGELVFARKNRLYRVPGSYDRAGRFYASENTAAVRSCRAPSRAWPYTQLQAAQTAAHCAEACGADSLLAVRRVVAAFRKAESLPDGLPPCDSAHSVLLAVELLGLKPVKRTATL